MRLHLGIEIPNAELMAILQGRLVHERVLRNEEPRMTCVVHAATNGQGGIQIMLRINMDDGDTAESWKG